jgi:hypothetical protein
MRDMTQIMTHSLACLSRESWWQCVPLFQAQSSSTKYDNMIKSTSTLKGSKR